MPVDDKHFRDETVSIPELVAKIGKVLDGYVFENCRIEGPAVLFLQNSELSDNGFQGSHDAILWEIPPRRRQVIGAVLVSNGIFRGCDFDEIGLAATPDFARRFRRDVRSG